MNKIFLALALLFSFSLYAKSAPSFNGKLLSGKRTTLKENLKPGRFLFLSFWATWCEPCMLELTEITKFKKEHPESGLDILGVNVDTSESATDIKPTMALKKFDFPVVIDPNHEIFSKFFTEKSLPFSCLIDGKGEILKTFSGYNLGMLAELEKTIGIAKK